MHHGADDNLASVPRQLVGDHLVDHLVRQQPAQQLLVVELGHALQERLIVIAQRLILRGPLTDDREPLHLQAGISIWRRDDVRLFGADRQRQGGVEKRLERF
jgi:hypothetical protein